MYVCVCVCVGGKRVGRSLYVDRQELKRPIIICLIPRSLTRANCSGSLGLNPSSAPYLLGDLW